MVYIDLDGVLADFQGWAGQFVPGVDYMDVFLYQYEDCFRDLEPIKRGITLLRAIKDPVILTAMPNYADFLDYAAKKGIAAPEATRRYNVMMSNKLTWVNSHIGTVPVIIVPTRKAKTQFAKGNILVDDYDPNIKDWRAAGGIGLLFKA